MEHQLLFLKGPSNIEKKVRELKTALYRDSGLASAQALPVMIPLCFVSADEVPQKPTESRDILRRAMGRVGPLLRSGSIVEDDGFLFWEIRPRERLEEMQRSCEIAFARVDTRQEAQQEARQEVQQPAREPARELFPPARGFFLCSLEGRPRSSLTPLEAPDPLTFPAVSAVLLRIRRLGADLPAPQRGVSAATLDPWWRSIFWEELARIPLRKT